MRDVPLFCALLLLLTFTASDCTPTDGWSLVLLPDAAASKGAVCLDGSPPGYHIRTVDSDPTRWMFHIQGGGWCVNEGDCLARSQTDLGSSKNFATDNYYQFFDGGCHGLFSSYPQENPNFWNYTKAYVHYCDGASFSGDVYDPVQVGNSTIYFRGRRVLDAIMQSLLYDQGMAKASEVIVHGCSAGGLSVFLHLDYLRSLIPATVRVVGAPESGFFLDLPNWLDKPSYTPIYQNVFAMQNCSANVNDACVEAHRGTNDTWKCFFAPYTLPFIKTPLHITNSLYDGWQLANIVQLPCINNLTQCTPAEMAAFENLRTTMIAQLAPALGSSANGVFADSCVGHCALSCQDRPYNTVSVGSALYSNAFFEWYTGANVTHLIDCQGYRCNPTC